MKQLSERNIYLLKKLGQGLIWLAVIILVFIFGRKHISTVQLEWIKPIFDNTTLVYSVYIFSEILFGLIPPEIFMIWGLQQGDIYVYIKIVSILFILSYFAGVFGYFFGKYLNSSKIFRFLRIKFLGKYLDKIQKYGAYMIIIAAITPIPFSGICMLVGASNYQLKKFLLFAITRMIRYSIYAWIIWEANIFS